MSSLLKWLASDNRNSGLVGRYPKPDTPGLPDPNKAPDESTARSFASANAEVDSLTQAAPQKRRAYHHYDDETRAKIAKSSEEIGMTATARKFTKELGYDVALTTVQSIRSQYRKLLATSIGKDPSQVTVLPHGKCGRPLLLGQDLDDRVSRYLHAIRDGGGKINRRIARATATGIVKAERPSLLKNHGGSLDINRSWAESFLRRHNLVKRKGTKAAKKLPENFAVVKEGYLQRIASFVQENEIPAELVINMDETGVKIVPVDNYTLEVKGAKQVPIVAMDDKRQITAVLACTLSGALLPPQVLYEGKTCRCHPPNEFPAGWDIWHTESHWSTSASILRYIEKVVEPYVDKVKEQLNLPRKVKSLIILDVFKAHCTQEVLESLRERGFVTTFVPANCTSELQPLDVSVNGPFKFLLKERFNDWFSDRVCDAIRKHPDDEKKVAAEVVLDLRLSVLKPIHARWMMDAFAQLQTKVKQVLDGWIKPGVAAAIGQPSSAATKVTPERQPPTLQSDVPDLEAINLATTCNPWKLGSCLEFCLATDVCQSRILGRNGSTACTVIAALVVKDALSGALQIEPGAEPSKESRLKFVAAMVKGNELYDAVAHLGLLAIYHVLELWPELGLRTVRHQDIGVHTRDQLESRMVEYLEKAPGDQVSAAVFVQNPMSVAVVVKGASVAIFDSHSHTVAGARRGALIGVSRRGTATKLVAEYIAGFFQRQHQLKFRDAHLCFLEIRAV